MKDVLELSLITYAIAAGVCLLVGFALLAWQWLCVKLDLPHHQEQLHREDAHV